jgi:hypothetical protein
MFGPRAGQPQEQDRPTGRPHRLGHRPNPLDLGVVGTARRAGQDQVDPLSRSLDEHVVPNTGRQPVPGGGLRREHRRDEVDRQVVVEQTEAGQPAELDPDRQLADAGWAVEDDEMHGAILHDGAAPRKTCAIGAKKLLPAGGTPEPEWGRLPERGAACPRLSHRPRDPLAPPDAAAARHCSLPPPSSFRPLLPSPPSQR